MSAELECVVHRLAEINLPADNFVRFEFNLVILITVGIIMVKLFLLGYLIDIFAAAWMLYSTWLLKRMIFHRTSWLYDVCVATNAEEHKVYSFLVFCLAGWVATVIFDFKTCKFLKKVPKSGKKPKTSRRHIRIPIVMLIVNACLVVGLCSCAEYKSFKHLSQDPWILIYFLLSTVGRVARVGYQGYVFVRGVSSQQWEFVPNRDIHKRMVMTRMCISNMVMLSQTLVTMSALFSVADPWSHAVDIVTLAINVLYHVMILKWYLDNSYCCLKDFVTRVKAYPRNVVRNVRNQVLSTFLAIRLHTKPLFLQVFTVILFTGNLLIKKIPLLLVLVAEISKHTIILGIQKLIAFAAWIWNITLARYNNAPDRDVNGPVINTHEVGPSEFAPATTEAESPHLEDRTPATTEAESPHLEDHTPATTEAESPHLEDHTPATTEAESPHLEDHTPATTEAESPHLEDHTPVDPATTEAESPHLEDHTPVDPATTEAESPHLEDHTPATTEAESPHLEGRTPVDPATTEAESPHLEGRTPVDPATTEAESPHLEGRTPADSIQEENLALMWSEHDKLVFNSFKSLQLKFESLTQTSTCMPLESHQNYPLPFPVAEPHRINNEEESFELAEPVRDSHGDNALGVLVIGLDIP